VKYLSSATVTFGAGHQIEGCDGGHQYTVTVTFSREGFHEADMVEWKLYHAKVFLLSDELKDRSLNKMLGSKYPNVFGIAAFFMERLTILMPVTKVEVREDSDPVAIIERDTDY
jgi:6-pyruvoyl-tetrahydropterin synthase